MSRLRQPFQGEDVRHALQPLRWALYALPILAIAWWLASGLFSIEMNEVGVHKRCGKVLGVRGPGIHYGLPWPIDTVDRVRVEEERRLEAGFWIRADDARVLEADDPTLHVLHNRYCLTADKNILHVRVSIRYKLNDACAVLYRTADAREILRAEAESAILLTLCRLRVDRALTTPLAVENAVWDRLTRRIERLKTGIDLRGLEIVHPRPPAPTEAAFKDVINAQEDSKKRVNEAALYRSTAIRRAEATADATRQESRSRAHAILRHAQARANSFRVICAEYERNRSATRARLYLEMAEKVFPQVRKVVLPRRGGDDVKLFLGDE